MSAITPVTAMPADSASPSGMLSTALPKVRLQASAASGGVKLTVIQKNEGGKWFRTPHVLDLDSGDVDEIIFDNPFGTNSFHVLKERGGYAGSESGTATCYIAGSTAAVSAGDLSVTNVSASGDLTVGDDATIGDDLTVTGDASVGGTFAVTGASTLTGQLSANGGTQLKGSAPSAAADAVMSGVADLDAGGTAALKTVYEGGSSLLERVYGTGAAKSMIIAQDVTDDGTIVLPVPASGKVGILDVAEITEWGKFSVQSDGTVTKLDGSSNAVATDTDAKFCCFKDTSTPTFKNRLGATKPVIGTYRYF